jgi:hypothetical protein
MVVPVSGAPLLPDGGVPGVGHRFEPHRAGAFGFYDQFESTDDVLRVRFIEWRRFRTALLRQGHRHRGIVSGLAGWATDLPLTAAMMRWAVSVRGDDLHDPAPTALRVADVIGLLS